ARASGSTRRRSTSRAARSTARRRRTACTSRCGPSCASPSSRRRRIRGIKRNAPPISRRGARGPDGGPANGSAKRSGQLDDVTCLEALGPLDDFKGDAVPFGKGAEPLGDDGSVMDEDVRTMLTHDETVPLRVVEPLHGALLGHVFAPDNELLMFAASAAAAPPPASGMGNPFTGKTGRGGAQAGVSQCVATRETRRETKEGSSRGLRLRTYLCKAKFGVV